MSKHRLLLADDSVTIQKVVNLTFAEEGVEVITAGDGNTAMEKFIEFPPDLVMVDVNMPGLDGYRICEMIKQDEETKQIPVILLVGSFEPFDEAEARRVGADDYLTKPFQSIRQLVNTVSGLLNRSNGNTSSNQADYTSENQATETSVGDFGSAFQTKDEAGFELLDDAGVDDEMIQTNQIGSLPVDETQKFVSEPHFQTSENDFAYSGATEKENSAETQSLTAADFESARMDSAEMETGRLDEKVFEFADEQPDAQENVLEFSGQETSDYKEFPDYSSVADDNENASSDADFNVSTQPKNAPVFDFDDLDLLDLSPHEEKSLPETERETMVEKIPGVSETVSVEDKKDSAEFGEKKDSTEMANLSPEVIEAIARKVMEKLSDKVIKEIAQGITPQTVESAIREMAQKKTN